MGKPDADVEMTENGWNSLNWIHVPYLVYLIICTHCIFSINDDSTTAVLHKYALRYCQFNKEKKLYIIVNLVKYLMIVLFLAFSLFFLK